MKMWGNHRLAYRVNPLADHFKRFVTLYYQTVIKIVIFLIGKITGHYQYQKDKSRSSHTKHLPRGELYHYFSRFDIIYIYPIAGLLKDLSSNYIKHRFDLLGSGWVKVRHGMSCSGLEGYRYNCDNSVIDNDGHWIKSCIIKPNQLQSQQIWKLIRGNYQAVDWHIDFKSGYRWNEKTWYRSIESPQKLGVDIKIPWELSRMQHLPQMALASYLPSASFCFRTKCSREFRNQVLDFIANNPPRFGVNWASTMDVGIRVANWLVAYDLFRSSGIKFDRSFIELFQRSVYEHGVHIADNLEWSPDFRGNHYLAAIAGLLFAAAYLPSSNRIDTWLAFSVHELIREVGAQFYPDGSNFEASTSYHVFSAEIVIYATAIVLALAPEKTKVLRKNLKTFKGIRHGIRRPALRFYPIPGKHFPNLGTKMSGKLFSPFPGWYFERLEKMAEFAMHTTKPDNHILQVGDNDSSRFFKFQPTHQKTTVAHAKRKYLNLKGYKDLPNDEPYLDEDILDHRHLVAAINGLFARSDFTAFTGHSFFEDKIVNKLSDGMILSSYKKIDQVTHAESKTIGYESEFAEFSVRVSDLPDKMKQYKEIKLPDDATNDLRRYAYTDFGLYIYRSKRVYLAIRCGSLGQSGRGGHAHCDQLSIELMVDGKDLMVDPGTYLYTPLPTRRNQYRSVRVHHAPQLRGLKTEGKENKLFRLSSKLQGKCLYFGPHGFLGMHNAYGFPLFRMITTQNDGIQLKDFILNKSVSPGPIFSPASDLPSKIPFSPGYGLRNA